MPAEDLHHYCIFNIVPKSHGAVLGVAVAFSCRSEPLYVHWPPCPITEYAPHASLDESILNSQITSLWQGESVTHVCKPTRLKNKHSAIQWVCTLHVQIPRAVADSLLTTRTGQQPFEISSPFWFECEFELLHRTEINRKIKHRD